MTTPYRTPAEMPKPARAPYRPWRDQRVRFVAVIAQLTAAVFLCRFIGGLMLGGHPFALDVVAGAAALILAGVAAGFGALLFKAL